MSPSAANMPPWDNTGDICTSMPYKKSYKNHAQFCFYFLQKCTRRGYLLLIYADFMPTLNIFVEDFLQHIFVAVKEAFILKKIVLVLITILNSSITIVNSGFTSFLWQSHSSWFIDFVICFITFNANLLYWVSLLSGDCRRPTCSVLAKNSSAQIISLNQ